MRSILERAQAGTPRWQRDLGTLFQVGGGNSHSPLFVFLPCLRRVCLTSPGFTGAAYRSGLPERCPLRVNVLHTRAPGLLVPTRVLHAHLQYISNKHSSARSCLFYLADSPFVQLCFSHRSRGVIALPFLGNRTSNPQVRTQVTVLTITIHTTLHCLIHQGSDLRRSFKTNTMTNYWFYICSKVLENVKMLLYNFSQYSTKHATLLKIQYMQSHERKISVKIDTWKIEWTRMGWKGME